MAAGRGVGNELLSSSISDSFGNAPYVLQSRLNYTNYPDSSAALYTFLNASGGVGQTVTLNLGFPDEGTIAVVEVKNGVSIVDMKSAVMRSGNLTSPSVTTTGPATIVAFAWGGGANGYSSITADNGFTILDNWGAPDTASVQAASASRDVAAAGTYNVTWTTNPPQEAILFIVALQAGQ